MKTVDDNGITMKNPPRTSKDLLFRDICHYDSPLSDLDIRNNFSLIKMYSDAHTQYFKTNLT